MMFYAQLLEKTQASILLFKDEYFVCLVIREYYLAQSSQRKMVWPCPSEALNFFRIN